MNKYRSGRSDAGALHFWFPPTTRSSETADRRMMRTEGARDRPAGIALRKAVLGFGLLVFGELGLSTELGPALTRCQPAIVGTLENALPLVFG